MMIEITINKIKDVDITKLAEFMYLARMNTVFHNENDTNEKIEEALEEASDSDNEIVLIAFEKGLIRGAMRIYTGFPEMSFAAKWHPIIARVQERDQIALDLIQSCKQYVKEKGFSRFEGILSPLTEKHTKTQREYQRWYERAGFYKATEEVFMQVDLDRLELPSDRPNLLEGLRYESIDNIENERMFEPCVKSFADNGDRLFRDMNRAQQSVSFNFWLRRSQPFHYSSIVIMADDNFVGLIVVRQKGDTTEIGPVAIVPEYKRRGIMNAAFHESLRRMQEDGLKFGQLEADAKNEPAINLYKKFGFQIQYYQEYYAWKVE